MTILIKLKKQVTFLHMFLSLCFYSAAQIKPALPVDFFQKFSYTLPAGFNYNDSLQLNTETANIARSLSKIQTEAQQNYTIDDAVNLYTLISATVATNTILENHQQVIDAIGKCRQLRSMPAYLIPYGLMELAYSKAFLAQKGNKNSSFNPAFQASLLEQLNQVDIEFRNDIVNLQKGLYNSSSVQRNWRNLTAFLDQGIKKSNGRLDYQTATRISTLFNAYNRAKNYQSLIESALFSITPSIVKEQQVKIPMHDGIKLNAYVYSDLSNNQKLPAIVSLSPYPTGTEAISGNVFATNGYIYVYIDTRGRRESEGSYMPYEDDARDYYDIIDWVSKQTWCTGQVATTGGSYIGFTQWQAIRKQFRHPALKAINPIASVGFGVDFPRFGHQFYPYILNWAIYVSGKELNNALFNDSRFWNDTYYTLYKNRLPFSKLDSVAGMPNAIFQKWVSHPDFDNYWQNILPSQEDYKAIDIPILSITGYNDADQTGAMYYYDNHQKYGNAKAKADHHLLIGPYDHGGAQWAPAPVQAGLGEIEKEAQVPIYKYVIRWFDWVLKGKKKPGFIKDRITYFETGYHTWKGTASFKDLTTDSLELFLTTTVIPNGKRKNLLALDSKKQSGNASVTYRHDIAMALDSAYLFATPKPYDDSLYLSSAYNLVFESQLLKKDIILTDKIFTRLYMSLNVPDADFTISVREISPDGKDRELAAGSVRVRYRNGGEKPQLVKPGETFLLNFDNANIYIKKLSKGSKLRLTFQSPNDLYSEKNFGFGGEVSKESTKEPRTIEARILTGNKYPSKVMIPYTTN